jgi:hypothetical protein
MPAYKQKVAENNVTRKRAVGAPWEHGDGFGLTGIELIRERNDPPNEMLPRKPN